MSDLANTRHTLYGNILSQTLSFLTWKEIIALRMVASTWKEAAADTSIDEVVHVRTQQELGVLSKNLPKLRSLMLDHTSDSTIFRRGEADDDDQPILYLFADIQLFQCIHTSHAEQPSSKLLFARSNDSLA